MHSVGFFRAELQTRGILAGVSTCRACFALATLLNAFWDSVLDIEATVVRFLDRSITKFYLAAICGSGLS